MNQIGHNIDSPPRCGVRHNVLILENELRMGGLEKKLLDLVSRIDKEHFRVVVCCLKKGGYFKDAFIDLGIPFYDNLMEHKYDVTAYFRLQQIIAKEKIDLIYTLVHPNTIVFSHFARLTKRVKRLVLSIHASGDPDGGRLFAAYQKPFLQSVDRFIAVAELHKRYLVEVEGLDPRRMTVIHNGVDTDRYKPLAAGDDRQNDFGFQPGDRAIVSVAMLNPRKRIDVLIQVFARLAAEFADAKLLVVGDGPERNRLVGLAKELDVGDKVTFAGLRDDIERILQMSSVFVLASRPGSETFPNVVLEAMATGMPVVATNVGSVGELVEDGQTGTLVDYTDDEALYDAIRELLEDGAKARDYGAEGRRVVETRYRLSGMCSKRELLFAELLCGQ